MVTSGTAWALGPPISAQTRVLSLGGQIRFLCFIFKMRFQICYAIFNSSMWLFRWRYRIQISSIALLFEKLGPRAVDENEVCITVSFVVASCIQQDHTKSLISLRFRSSSGSTSTRRCLPPKDRAFEQKQVTPRCRNGVLQPKICVDLRSVYWNI